MKIILLVILIVSSSIYLIAKDKYLIITNEKYNQSKAMQNFGEYINDDNVSFQISPNPATETLSIKLPENKTFDLEVLNMLGQIVYTQSNAIDQVYFSCNNIPTGVYLIKAISDDTILTINFVKR